MVVRAREALVRPPFSDGKPAETSNVAAPFGRSENERFSPLLPFFTRVRGDASAAKRDADDRRNVVSA